MIFKNQLIKILLTLFMWNSVSFLQTDNWKHFDKENSGLPTNTIRCVTQDQKGIYWIGTWDAGLVKFDGKNWTVYNTKNSGLPNNCVYSITFDKKENFTLVQWEEVWQYSTGKNHGKYLMIKTLRYQRTGFTQ